MKEKLMKEIQQKMSAYLNERQREQLTAVLPSATCILILTLYVLAFFRRLSWIDYFSTAIVAGAVLRVLFLSGEKKKKLFGEIAEKFSKALDLPSGVGLTLLIPNGPTQGRRMEK